MLPAAAVALLASSGTALSHQAPESYPGGVGTFPSGAQVTFTPASGPTGTVTLGATIGNPLAGGAYDRTTAPASANPFPRSR